MAGKNFLRTGTETTGFGLLLNAIEGDVKAHIEKVARTLHEELVDATVVWSGETAMNWKASSGAPDTSSPVKSSAKGDFEDTNRPMATQKALATQANFDFSVIQDHYVTNSSEAVLSLEYGELPTPERYRGPPAGITQTAIQATLRKV